MRLVVDANILFAALIRDSTVAKIIFETSIELYVPDILLEELQRNEFSLRAKSNRLDFDATKERLLQRITRHPPALLEPYWERAISSCPDPKDTPYFALALALDCAFWTNERGMEKQDAVRIVRTDELLPNP